MQVVHQCPHYQRSCKFIQYTGHIQAPCCKQYYPCKLCHDDHFQYKKGCQVQRMEFQKVQHLKCLNCQEIQEPSEKCSKCEIKFGEYACVSCRLYENNPTKVEDIFHCDKCKMCRRGNPQNVTHCFTCGYCVPNSANHKCLQNVGESTCPVCLSELLYSTQGYISMKCGHLIHVSCWTKLRDINCPTCGMANQNMSEDQIKKVEEQIQKTKDKLPAELKDSKVNILCNECLHKTVNASFHFYGVKCQKCGTFNTKMI